MPLSARRLGEALAARLNAVVPNPIRVLVERPSSSAEVLDADVIVRVVDGAEPWGGQGFSNLDLNPHGDASLGERACSMAIAMLGGVQDSVIGILRERWPVLPAGDLALPDGRTDSERVYLWYGEVEDRAALTLEPIEVRELSL